MYPNPPIIHSAFAGGAVLRLARGKKCAVAVVRQLLEFDTIKHVVPLISPPVLGFSIPVDHEGESILQPPAHQRNVDGIRLPINLHSTPSQRNVNVNPLSFQPVPYALSTYT